MTKSNYLAHQRRFFVLFHAALWLLSLLSAAPTFAQLQIVSRSPDLDDIRAAAFTDIRVGFNQPLTNFANGIHVWGNFHGRYAGALNYDAANRTLAFTPSQSFVDGEEITVVATTAITGLAQPYIWRFLIRNNIGTGTFVKTIYDLESVLPISGVNQEPTHLVAADFNSDDFIDLAVVHHGANRLVVLRNTVRETAGASLFTPFQPPLITGNTPVHAVAANLNSDNNLDLAVVNFNGNSLQIFTGNGAGQFSAPQTIPTGARPIHLLAQDFNGDGAIDLAVTLFGADRVDIFLNNGSNNFPATASQSLPVDFGPVAATAWDYDQNGAFDIIVANHGAKSLLPLNNNGRANFTPGALIPLSTPPVDLVSGDVRGTTGNQAGDGRRELLALCSELHQLGKTANSSGPQAVTSALAIVSFNNNSFTPPETVSLAGYAQALTLCNVDTLDTQRGPVSLRPDLDLDLFYTRFRDDRISWLRNPDNQSFENLTPVDLDTVTSAKAITHLDIDRDGDNDLVVSNYLQNQLVVYLNQGNRIPPCTPLDTLNFPVSVVDFGDVWVRQTRTRPLFLNNSNSLPFSFTTALSRDSVNFSLSPRRGTLPSNGVARLNTGFTPGDTLSYETDLLITTDDPLASTSCSVILRGRGVRATIVVADSLNFGCVPPGQTATRQLRIQNTGNIPLVLAGATNSTPQYFNAPNLINQQIAPRSFIDVPVIFTPDTIRTFLDSLKISSNDLDRPIATVYLRGCGSPPVNDAPVFEPIGDQTIFERDRLILNIVARDPENDPFALSAQNLPAGATFVDQGNGQGQFSWRPDFGTAGQYAVTFLAREQNTVPPLTGSLTVNIIVLRRQPDLYIAALSGVRQPARLNQVVTVTAAFADSSAPAPQSFRAQLLFDNQILADTLIASLQAGETVSVSRPFGLTALGRHFFEAKIDVNNTVVESNENNNALRLEFDVQPGQLAVAPNPFTPNNDGFNDAAIFELGNVGIQSPQLKIFDLQGNLLKSISSSQTAQLRWDGNDNSGRPQPPGPYLYLLLDADKKIASGYVVLAR